MKYLIVIIMFCSQLFLLNSYGQDFLHDSIPLKRDTTFISSKVSIVYWNYGRLMVEKYEVENGVKNGLYIYYYTNKKPFMIGQYSNNIRQGYWYIYTPCGRLELVILYKDGDEIKNYYLSSEKSLDYNAYEVCCNDTINRVDTLNHKQGVWVTYGQAEGKLRFFKIYKNDFVISDVLVYNSDGELEKINIQKDDYFIPCREGYDELWDEYYYKNKVLIEYATKHIQCNQ